MLIPHVVSAVERHQRQLTIKVTVKDSNGETVPATVERDVAAEVQAARRGALPLNVDVEAFLQRAKDFLDKKLLVPGGPYVGTDKVRKSLDYWFSDGDGNARLKIHFGDFRRDIWSPIQVGLYVESKERKKWQARIQKAMAAGQLPAETQISTAGKLTVAALKEYEWTAPMELTDALLQDVCSTLLRFAEVFGG